MATRFRSCSPESTARQVASLMLVLGVCAGSHLQAQLLIRPVEPTDQITILPSDMAIFEAGEPRKEIDCSVTPRKADLGFDLRFHSGYEVTVPLSDISGEEGMLTVVFRVRPDVEPERARYFVQHFTVPAVPDDAKGDAVLDGIVDMGEGSYHVDWLLRDRSERICSSSWDVEAELNAKDKPMNLFLSRNAISETAPQPFLNDTGVRRNAASSEMVNVKLLVNFAPQMDNSATLQRMDTDALVSILKTIQRDDRVGKISLIAFNMSEERIVYRQETADQIDFPALGKALDSMKLGTVSVSHLGEKQGETNFLESLIQKEMSSAEHPDAVIFAGPKAMLKADVPQDDLRRIGEIECPVFYMNYNLNPQAVPWKDSISHAIKAFRGVEYTISRPRDLWFSKSEMVDRIVRSKKTRLAALNASSAGTR